MTSQQLIADAAKLGCEFSAEEQAALRVLDGNADFVVLTPWTHAMALWIDFEQTAHISTTQSVDYTSQALSAAVAGWVTAVSADLGGDGDGADPKP